MTARPHVLVMQHSKNEHLGLIGGALRDERVTYHYCRLDEGERVPISLSGFDGMILMGGPQGSYEEDRFEFLRAEKRLVKFAVDADIPVLGVCLGSQILADVLGARVYRGRFELGWKEVVISLEIANDYVFGRLPRIITPLHWHGDSFELPKGARALGSSEQSPVQGFVWRQSIYALLFHLEMTTDQVSAMAAQFPDDLVRGGVGLETLIKETELRAPAIEPLAATVFRRWARLLRRPPIAPGE